MVILSVNSIDSVASEIMKKTFIVKKLTVNLLIKKELSEGF